MNKICPNASITVDRFHVTQMLHEELNQARIDQKKVAKSLNLKERTKLFGSLKGSKYILLKAEPNLSSKQKKKLLDVKTAESVTRNHALLKRRVFYAFLK